MPDAEERRVAEKAREDEREGKLASTQAGEFVREEIHHVRERKHGARSPQQAIAIGLSKTRRAGVKLPPPRRGSSKPEAPSRARHRKRAKAFGRPRLKNALSGHDGSVEARGPLDGFADESFAPSAIRCSASRIKVASSICDEGRADEGAG